MVVCTFFGHRDSPEHLQDALSAAIKQAILKYHVDTFYVGNHGRFDAMALHALKEAQKMFPHISYSVVLAYFPTEQTNTLYEHTLYPEGLETVPKKFAISFRNKWMVAQADVIIAYITRTHGGAAQFVRLAQRKGKPVIWLASPPENSDSV